MHVKTISQIVFETGTKTRGPSCTFWRTNMHDTSINRYFARRTCTVICISIADQKENFWWTRSTVVARMGRLYRSPSSDFWSQKENDFTQWLQSRTGLHSDAAISNATINARIRYGNSEHVGDDCRQKLRYQKIAAKLLQIESMLLVTAYRNTSYIVLFNSIIADPLRCTPYSLVTIHALERLQTDDTSYPKINLTVGRNN